MLEQKKLQDCRNDLSPNSVIYIKAGAYIKELINQTC